MTVGRKPKYDIRMKPNGLPAELDDWFRDYAQTLGKTGAELKREVLGNFRTETLKNQNSPDVPGALVGGE